MVRVLGDRSMLVHLRILDSRAVISREVMVVDIRLNLLRTRRRDINSSSMVVDTRLKVGMAVVTEVVADMLNSKLLLVDRVAVWVLWVVRRWDWVVV